MQGLLSVLHPQLSPVNPLLQLQTPQIHCPRLRPEKIQINDLGATVQYMCEEVNGTVIVSNEFVWK